jgi:3-methyladenine DNA glycosylase AlkD
MLSRRSVNPSVRRSVDSAIRALRAVADPKRAEGQRRYFKAYEKVHFFGVATPDVRRIAREVWHQRRDEWDVTDAVEFCDVMVHRSQLEAKALGVLVLTRFERSFPKTLLRKVKRWLADDLLSTWAAVDAVSPWVITPLLDAYPELGDTVMGWTRSRNVWVRRAAPVSFIPLARRGARLGDAYRIAQSLFGDDHDLIHKATGWLLREAGKTDQDRLERFLARHGPRIPRTALRYAIERFPPARRRQLLESTR